MQKIRETSPVSHAARIHGDGEWFSMSVIVLSTKADDIEAVMDVYGMCYRYSGPGRSFATEPSVKVDKYTTRIEWSGGLDI